MRRFSELLTLKKEDSIKGTFFAVIASILTVLGYSSVGNITFILGLLAIIILCFACLNFYATLFLTIALIFICYPVIYLQISVWMVLVLLFSFLMNFYNVNKQDLDFKFKLPFAVYLLSISPSLLNTIDLKLSLILGFNFIAIVLISFILSIALSTRRLLDFVINSYQYMLVIASLQVIILVFLSNDRDFGLTKVFYVDLVGIGVVIQTIQVFLRRSKIPSINILNIFFYIILVLGLIMSQTRNAWISTAFTIVIMFLYLLKNPLFGLKRKKLIVILSFVIVSSVTLFVIGNLLSPNISKRAESLTENKTIVTDDPQSVGANSLVSRVFIWHTAIVAFQQHPYVGIGWYSFPHASHLYYKIPKSFFIEFVEQRNPHSGYLAVLTETGILGFLGFLFMIICILKFSINTIKQSRNQEEYTHSLIFTFSIIYISFSFIMTNEWIMGQMGVLFGIILGLTTAHKRILQSERVRIDKQ